MLVRAGLGIVAALTASVVPWQRRSSARAQEALPHLAEDDPMAQALMYVEDANATSNPARQADAFCHNCRFFTGGDADWGPCQLFPQNTVARNGWCSVWAARE